MKSDQALIAQFNDLFHSRRQGMQGFGLQSSAILQSLGWQ